jgi:putative oxidoreductase
MSFENRLRYSLFGLRLGVFLVMFMWTIDKFINPDHAARVFEKFYLISGLSVPMYYAIGAVQAAIVLAFVAGIQKRLSYGLVFLMHLVSTVSSYERYLDPWNAPNLLFFAAFPMLAAIAALYLLRDEDTFLTWRGKRTSPAA